MKKLFDRVYQLLKSVVSGYRADDCDLFAAVISFYAIFSMLPLAMITAAILAHVLGSSVELIQHFQALVASVIPTASDQLMLILRSALEKKQRVSLMSAGALIVIATFLVSALERALDRVFRSAKKRNYFHSRFHAERTILFLDKAKHHSSQIKAVTSPWAGNNFVKRGSFSLAQIKAHRIAHYL